MKTFTNYAEKKAKQFFNLLQGYTKGIRITAILILLLMGVGNMSAADITSDGTARLYFEMSAVSWWTAGNNGDGNFGYFYNNTTSKNAWSAHSVKHDGNTYYVVIPEGTWKNVILTRNNTSTSPSWDNKWNQTGDITLSSSSNYISTFSENSGSVTWGTAIKPASTGSLSASSTSVNIGANVTLTPSLTSNQTINDIKSTTYSISPNSGASINGNTFTATKSGTYTVTATITYNPDGYTSLTSEVSPTVTITVNPWTITWDPNGGSVTPTSSTYDGANAVSLPTPTRTGYNFVGWFTAASGGTKINDIGTTTKPTSDVTYYAHWTPKTYTITLDANDGESDGSATATYNSNTVKNATYPTRTDYRCNGYYTAASDGTLVLNTDGTLAKNVSGYTDANGNWIKDDDATLYAQWTYDVTEYTVTFGIETGSTSYGSLTAYNNNTSASITSPAQVRSGQRITFTATPKTGYVVEGWYTNAACTAGKHNAGNTTYTPTITAATNVYVKFVEKTWPVTVAAATGGSVSPSGSQTVGQVTGISINANPDNGYTFNKWTITSGSGSFTLAATTNSNKFKPTADATVEASFNETLSTLTTSNNYTEGNPGYDAPTATKTQIGVATTAQVTATTPSGAYAFTGWTLTNCERTDNGDATALTITVRSNGDGAAATVIANYEKIPSKTVYFRPKTDWKNNNPVIICDGTPNAVTPYDCAGEYYTAEVPGGTTNLKFGGNDEQTLPLTVPADDKVLYDMTSKNITKLYLKANNAWKADGARFAAYFYGNGDKWVSMTTVADQTDLYEVAIPTDKSYPSVIFCRMNGGNQTNNWDNRWDQTEDLSIPTNGTNTAQLPSSIIHGVTWHTTWDDSRWKEFTAPTYDITLDQTTGGTISVSKSSGITLNEQVTVTMTADPGYSFQSGTIKIGNQEEQTISTTESTHTICGPTTITATWKPDTHTVTFDANGHGTAPDKQSVDHNEKVEEPADPTANGYTFGGWYTDANCNTAWNFDTDVVTADMTLYAKWTPTEYTITFDKQNGIGGTDEATVNYKNNNYSVNPVEVPNRTGYTFGGYYTQANGLGVQVVSAEGQWVTNATDHTDADGKWLVHENTTLYAKWTAKTYTVTLDQTEAKVEGTTSVTATYDAAMPSATMPTAAAGYAFMGYFDGEQGAGTPYYDAKGASAHVWDKAEEATLYAHFAKAEITQITLDKYTFEPVEAGGTGFVTATPTIEPTPTNDVVLCWRLLYNSGNPVAGRDAQEVSGDSVQFSIAGLAAGTYKIEAVLRTGSNCGSGEVLSTKTVNFSIASTYTITVKYTCDGKEIMAASKVPARVSEETEITAPDITGYTFSSWEAGDGVTIQSTDGNSVNITAIYDGYLTAKYTARPMVYFKNTLGWEKVYVYTFNNQVWHNGNNGTGGDSDDMGVQPKSNRKEFGEMTLVEGTDDIYFFELNPTTNYTQDNANENYIAFSDQDMSTYNFFYGTKAVYRGDHKNNLTLFIPQADQKPETYNGTQYYSTGIWMKYNSTESGYQIPSNLPGGDWNTYTDNFTTTNPGGYTFSITKNLAANTEYEFKIRNYVWIHNDWEDNGNGKDNNQWFGYDGTIQQSVSDLLFHDQNAEKKGYNNTKIKTTAAGEYIFTIDLSQGKVLLSVEYPIEVGDYRVIYKDNATWSKGTAHDANWYHPSRIIKKNKTAEPTKDIISFFISYGQNTTMQFQRVKSITNGKVTWESAGDASIPNAVKEAGVYNFIVTQAANGASISMEDSAEPYTGNYYIRVDALAGKWDNYKTNPENRMTYSAFSESEANSSGEKFSHYATKYCTNGTNIKFTIANDYSPCISDTLVQDVVNPLGNLDSEGTLLSNDMYNANVRFMWNRKTNKISRAYVGPAGDKQSQFLMLRTNVEMQDAAGALDAAEGDIIDAGNSIYAARFADTQNWIYERTVKVKPGTRVKLYASYPKCYHIYVENNTGWDEIALYAWKENGDKPLGEWPGLRPARTVEIDGTTYHDFHVNEWVFGSKLILNNNNQGQQKTDFNDIVDAGNYYLSATTSNTLTKVKYVANVTEANAQYFRGAYDDNNAEWNDNNSVVILGGTGDSWNKIRIIYDFKTNRLMAALVPDQEVSGEKTIAADVMIIRKHQDAATSITLTNDNSKLKEVKTVYGSLQLNRWVLNNRKSDKSGIEYCTKKIDNQDTYDENVTNEHHPVLSTGEQKSIYERALYFISFPFNVHLSDVFGFGTYGTHWVISDYNGLRRAQRGYFAEDCINEDCTNWDYIWDPADFVLEANKGYLLSLDLDLMRYDNTDFWLHNIDQVELYFPSTANLATIEKTSYTMPALSEEYLCKINHNTDGTTPDRDRRVKDSYWRCIGVPSFANYDGSLYKSKEDAEANEGEGQYPINWKDDYTWTADESGFPFLYEWNVTDNSLSVQNTSAYQFKPTFAYLVQNGDAIYWKAVNTKPLTPIIARQRTEADRNYEWKIALLSNGNQEDQTFLRITDNENVTTAFDFNQDLAKEFNYGRGDIYTLIGYERVAANSMPCSDKTTIIPLGLNIEQAGDYTIAMPEGVENIGITLVDNEMGIHTNLSAGQEYTLTLNNGICENRLFIEVSPIQNTPTDLEYTTGDTREQTTRKVLIDGKLYIVCDGVVYDAQGHRL